MNQAQTKILKKLEDYLILNPEMRLGQALVNLNIVIYKYSTDSVCRDPFYDTDEDVLKRMK